MGLGPGLHIRPTQSLVMSQQLQAAIKLLTHGYKRKNEASAADRGQHFVLLAQTYEDLIGDRDAARQSYRKAAQADPENEAAKAALARYEAEDANFARIAHRKGK